MSDLAKNGNKNKFCEFNGDKCHNTDECIHLKKQIKEAVKSRKLSQPIKELKHGATKENTRKPPRKGKPPARKRPPQSLWSSRDNDDDGQESLMVVEAETPSENQKTNDPSHNPATRVHRGNILAVKADIVDGVIRRRGTLYNRYDGFHDRSVSLSVQRYHWTNMTQKTPSSTIYHTRDAQVPSAGRDSNIA
ncbi:hypothetical protein Tco_0593670 [Tanacetum coccineum]